MRPENCGMLTRRKFLRLSAASGVGLSLAGVFAAPRLAFASPIAEMLLYVGTYTGGNSLSKGIYIYRFDPKSGDLKPSKTVEGVIEPSFLAVNENRTFLYAVNETVEFEGKKSGAVSAFSIDQSSGDLKFLNQQPSLGGAPCFVSVSSDGRFVLVANYVGGSVIVLPVRRDGSLGEAVDLRQHAGSGPNRERQESAHTHSIVLDKKNRFGAACDLGSDKVFLYEFDRKSGKLKPNSAQSFFQTAAGAGPRHFSFHPTERYAYVINELSSSITSLAYDRRRGTLAEIQTISTLPGDFTGANTCADVHVSPSGSHLYGSNRGHDSIVVYRIDKQNGKLTLVEHISTRGKTPRNFTIDPTGKFLLVANQNSDSIVVFRVDQLSGRLSRDANVFESPTPVCLELIPVVTRIV